MGSRNRQRPTFEKRQREIARQERQAEKRARRRDRAAGIDGQHFDPDAPRADPDEPATEGAPRPEDVASTAANDHTIAPGIS